MCLLPKNQQQCNEAESDKTYQKRITNQTLYQEQYIQRATLRRVNFNLTLCLISNGEGGC